MNKKNTSYCGEHNNIKDEILAHLPCSVFSVIIGISFVSIFYFLVGGKNQNNEETNLFIYLFDHFHYMHLIFSSAATTALLTRKNKGLLSTLSIGVFSSIVFCSISDNLIPWIGGLFIDKTFLFHFCFFEHWIPPLSFSIFGSAFGRLLANNNDNATVLSHSGHVMFSTLASVLYIVAFDSSELWLQNLPIVFFCTFIAVVIPCCLSDFYIPMLFVRKENKT